MSSQRDDSVTNADLRQDVQEVKEALGVVLSQMERHEECQEDHGRRLTRLEEARDAETVERAWLRESIIRLADSVDAVRTATTVIAQRAEAGDTAERQMARELRALGDLLRAHVEATRDGGV
jgi:hypothetical protein